MKKNKPIYLLFSMLLFAIIGIYFSVFSFKHDYLGISADFIDNKWVVNSIHRGGAAYSSQLSEGDTILEVDHQKASDNALLNKWLIVEQATSLTVIHDGKEQTVQFNKSKAPNYLFLLFGTLSTLLFLFSLIYFKGREISQTSRRYYVFLVFTSLLLVSVIPSSMGNFLARCMMTVYVTLFPLFIDIFWRASSIKQASSKLSRFSLLVLFYSIFTTGLLLYGQIWPVHTVVVVYLARGIFYISFLLLLILSFISLSKRRGSIASQVNIIVLGVLCLLPLFIGYILPFPYKIPFFYALPLLLLPIIAIVYELIVNRLINFRFQLPRSFSYIVVSAIATILIMSLYLIVDYLPLWLMLAYTFLLVLCLLPTLRNVISLNLKSEYTLSNQTIFSAVEMEREDISIFIHDTIIQDIIYHKRQIENATEDSKAATLSVMDDLLFELRELCSNIYPLMIQELGLKNAILDIVNKFQKKESVLITVDIDVASLDFGNGVNNFVLRSIRELINNSILHGDAKQIDIQIYENDEQVTIAILDDGRFETMADTEVPHFGLRVIAEKLVLLGGELRIETEPTKISMKIPKEKGGL